jgi:hypothetical protein
MEPLRLRETKGAATDMFYLTPQRHISTLPFGRFWHIRRMSGSVEGFGCRPIAAMRLAPWPASESLQ